MVVACRRPLLEETPFEQTVIPTILESNLRHRLCVRRFELQSGSAPSSSGGYAFRQTARTVRQGLRSYLSGVFSGHGYIT